MQFAHYLMNIQYHLINDISFKSGESPDQNYISFINDSGYNYYSLLKKI